MLVIDGYNLLFALFGEDIFKKVNFKRDELIELIESYSLHKRKKFVIYFDSRGKEALISLRSRLRKGQLLEIIFVANNTTADDEIIKLVRNTVDKTSIKIVSSDLRIIKEAQDAGVKYIWSKDFAKELKDYVSKIQTIYEQKKQRGISNDEVDYWLKEFDIDEEKIKRFLSGEE
jgi:predicted RNA-binding protein with PIN domain